MYSVGARFSEVNYIKVDVDFENGDNEALMITEYEGSPLTLVGVISWEPVE